MNSLSLAKIYLKTGQVVTLPFRSGNTDCQSSCATHPSSQLIRWINRTSAAQPGFVVNIKSIFFRVDNSCSKCFEQLATFLNKYRLASQTRVISVENSIKKPCSCGCGGGTSYEFEGGFKLKGAKAKGLNTDQKNQTRDNARSQYYDKNKLDATNTTDQLSFNNLQINHRIPLEHIHKAKKLRATPNKRNLQSLPTAVHAYVSKLWAGFKPVDEKQLRSYAVGVDRVIKAQSAAQVKQALEQLQKINPTIDVNTHYGQLVSGGKSIFWTKDFLQRNPQWNTSSIKTFGKELELMMQEIFQQEFAF